VESAVALEEIVPPSLIYPAQSASLALNWPMWRRDIPSAWAREWRLKVDSCGSIGVRERLESALSGRSGTGPTRWERGPMHRRCGSGQKYKANGLRKWWRSRDQHQGRRAEIGDRQTRRSRTRARQQIAGARDAGFMRCRWPGPQQEQVL